VKKMKLLIVLLCAFLVSCENPIMERWWAGSEPEPEPPEREYIPIMKMIPQIIYEIMIQHEIVYNTIIERIIEQLPPEVITRNLSDEEIIELIRQLPPEELLEYLTSEQIRYIIMQQPPSMILQHVTIIGIEYIIFSGDAEEYNANSPSPSGTSLTAQERNTNNATVTAMARSLADNSEYLMILHGHANPIGNTPDEKAELERISLNRARAVEAELKTRFSTLNGRYLEEDRVSTSGYGGEKNLILSGSIYAGLNRRVEMILIRLETIRM